MKVPGKLPVPGRPTNLDNGRARAYCTCSRCGREWLFGHFQLGCFRRKCQGIVIDLASSAAACENLDIF